MTGWRCGCWLDPTLIPLGSYETRIVCDQTRGVHDTHTGRAYIVDRWLDVEWVYWPTFRVLIVAYQQEPA